MTVFEFAIVASGADPRADDFEDRFFAAGCDDATVSFVRGVTVLVFAREAETLEAAIASAIADVRKTGVRVERVEPDPLVSLSEIAARSGLTRAAISLYAKGERGSGFPPPIARITGESPLWDWSDVAEWLHVRKQIDAEAVDAARLIKAVNARLRGENRRVA